MRYDIPPDKLEEQIQREQAQREAALGKRYALAQDGFLGPVISRWINASVSPVAIRIRQAATCYLKKDHSTFARLLDSPTFGLASAYGSGSPEYLEPILKWCLKGGSPGRVGQEATFCEDLVLATLGKTISDLAQRSLINHGAEYLEAIPGLSLAMILANAGASARETALGQFITMVQSADAMAKIRRPDRSSWAQRQKMSKVAAVLSSQVRQALEMEAKGEISLEHFGARTIVRVIDPHRIDSGNRRLTIKAKDLIDDDWSLLKLAAAPKGEQDDAKNAWITFAMMVLCAAQVEHGWFDLAKAHTPRQQKARRNTGRTRYLVLAEKPRHHLKQDLDKWVSLGFAFDPMIVPPRDGSYLTVKTKCVTGRNGPHGWRTVGASTTAWECATQVMGDTPWKIAKGTLDEIVAGTSLTDRAYACVPDETARRLILGAYSRDSLQESLYLPLYMDFRGRLYPRTSWVSYQGNDLQKGLLQFTPGACKPDETALALHVTALMGFDKKALPERLAIYKDLHPGLDVVNSAEEPIQLWTALDLISNGRGDEVPIQVDGTCNGLQHLSAMFRDADAAPWVNIAGASYEDTPQDLYGSVASRASFEVARKAEQGETWARRLLASGAVINRAVCKRPVMVLPYGGTMIAIEDGVTTGILGQEIKPQVWQECWAGPGELDQEALTNGYLSFKDRPLNEHPLFRRDMQKLGQVVYGAIKTAIPKAIEAMEAFRAIAGMVGDRSLEWSNRMDPNPMWIVHAYPKSERRTNIFRGFHLPNSVRGLAMKSNRDDIDPGKHRAGIVANFIHSQDAAHLAETMRMFKSYGGTTFGANHDCLYTRSSEAKIVGAAVRKAFAERYLGDPLRGPVRLRHTSSDGKESLEEFDSWYALADKFKVQFPAMGTWDPNEVMKSAWFFS